MVTWLHFRKIKNNLIKSRYSFTTTRLTHTFHTCKTRGYALKMGFKCYIENTLYACYLMEKKTINEQYNFV